MSDADNGRVAPKRRTKFVRVIGQVGVFMRRDCAFQFEPVVAILMALQNQTIITKGLQACLNAVPAGLWHVQVDETMVG